MSSAMKLTIQDARKINRIKDSKKNLRMTTIEKVRTEYKRMIRKKSISLLTKVELKAWLTHSERRHKNGHQPFIFEKYTRHMTIQLYIDQVTSNVLDVSEFGEKETVLDFLENKAVSAYLEKKCSPRNYCEILLPM
ncbi:hypothetical protein AEA09_12785 [Lysinibacillus contaminans]|uniref:Integrase SAM-like N-terminal domain-containing protein n=1 Tax=Lysinibacillus contaminans TaxID=1293441 RepID=A0ABR5K347_9BACI|nr:hypothetical protein [Lysinibacillus contaminans]KOS69348.1 hypothetical protein AEA09_12785 [Lysinibacillus contaminans]